MIMPARDPIFFSQSSLQDYVDCPRRFQLRYLEQLAWPAVETEPALETERRQREGQLFHRLAQQYLLGLPAEKLARMANTPNLRRWWENFIQYPFGLNDYTRTTEQVLSAPLGEQRLIAKYDLVAVSPSGKALIFDWKTYHKRPRDEWMAARLQTRVYRALLVQAGAHLNQGQPFAPERIEMVYWYADYPAEPARFPYNMVQFKRDWDFLEKLAAEISTTPEFPLSDDVKQCSFCPYRSYCDRGAAAGTWEQAEAEIEATFDLNFEQIAEIEF